MTFLLTMIDFPIEAEDELITCALLLFAIDALEIIDLFALFTFRVKIVEQPQLVAIFV